MENINTAKRQSKYDVQVIKGRRAHNVAASLVLADARRKIKEEAMLLFPRKEGEPAEKYHKRITDLAYDCEREARNAIENRLIKELQNYE